LTVPLRAIKTAPDIQRDQMIGSKNRPTSAKIAQKFTKMLMLSVNNF